MKDIVITQDSRVSVSRLWQVVTDWDVHSRAFPFTRMTVLSGDRGVGQRLLATTGVGPLRMRDPMTVQRWQLPGEDGESGVFAIRKTGRVVRGGATVRVDPAGSGSRLTWRTDAGLAPVWPHRLTASVSRLAGRQVYRHAVSRLVREAEHGRG